MGSHVHSIYRISPTDARNLYVFVFAIPPWEDEYDWIEEKFVTISKALGVEGLLVMGEPGKLEPELAEAYGDLDDSIRHLPSLRSSGLIVAMSILTRYIARKAAIEVGFSSYLQDRRKTLIHSPKS